MNIFKKEVLFSALMLILGIGLISNQAVAQEKPQKEDAKLYGKVVDDNTDKALTGIEVKLEGEGQKATTGDKGMFAIKSLTPGTYTVTVKAEGYKDWKKEVKVTAKGKQLTVKLKPAEG